MNFRELTEASQKGPVYIRQKHPRNVDAGAFTDASSTTYLLVNSLSKVPCGYNYGVLLQDYALDVKVSVEYTEYWEKWRGKRFAPTCVIDFDSDKYRHVTEDWLSRWEFVEGNRLPDHIANFVEDQLFREMNTATNRWTAWQHIREDK